MWIDKRKDKLLACERFYDEITGKNIKISVIIAKDTAQERKKAQKALQAKWEEMHQPVTDLRLSDIGRLYFADARDRLKEQTIIRDKGNYQRFVAIVGNVLIDNLKASYIKSKLVDSGKPNTTLNGYIKNFKIIMRWAYKNEYTDNISVVDRLQKFPDRTAKEKIQDKYLEQDEIDLLLDAMTEEHWHMLTRFLLLTGMRIGEAIALTDDDVDIKNRTITINKTYVQMLQKVSTAKTIDSNRTIHIQPELFALVNKIRKWSAEIRMITGERNNVFFVSPNGKYITYDVYEKYLREVSERVLNRRITAHVLRHTFTSIYAEKGLTLEQISRQLGHSDSRITKEVYYHVTEAQKAKDAAALDKISIFAH